jgi:ABC-type transport system involved in multi-copper enzyme maturation permease subunit
VSRGRLAKYSLWQFRDFVIDRGIAIVIIGFLWGYALLEPVRRTLGPQLADDRSSPVWVLSLQVSSAIVSVAVLIALNGIVSNDRKMGYYRFLFSKPVNPVLYYAQLFLVYMVGVLATMLLLSGLLHTVLPSFSVLNFLLYTALMYVAMGGIGFFLSVATRYDWLTLAAVWLGARILRTIYGQRPDWRSKAVELLPPVHRLDEVANSLIGSGTAPASDVLWLVGYGALFFALGLIILRRGSLAD